jgi:hypothetical protein
MADSIRKRILQAVITRVAAITTENGYTTDAGRNVLVGLLPKLGDGDPESVIAISLQDQSAELTRLHVAGTWPIEIIAVVNANAQRDEPALLVEDVLADIQRALELEDRTLGGLINAQEFEVGPTRVFGRDSASDVVAASQTYSFYVQRAFGAPDVRR